MKTATVVLFATVALVVLFSFTTGSPVVQGIASRKSHDGMINGYAAANPDVANPESAKPEPAKPVAAIPEVANPEPAKPEAAKPEAAKPEAAKPEAVKPEAPMPETRPEKRPEPEPGTRAYWLLQQQIKNNAVGAPAAANVAPSAAAADSAPSKPKLSGAEQREALRRRQT